MAQNRLTVSGVLAGIVFAIGFVSILIIPGLGGSSKSTDFTNFYNSSSHRGRATALGFVLLVGCWLMLWFFTELRTRVTASVRSELAYRLSIVGAASVIVGTAIDLGPAMVQNNQDNKEFVGIPIAHTFAQAGAGVAIVGMFTFAAAVLLVGLEFRRSSPFPGWLGIFSIVVAILLISSFFGIGAFLLPIWTIVVGIVGRSTTSEAVTPS